MILGTWVAASALCVLSAWLTALLRWQWSHRLLRPLAYVALAGTTVSSGPPGAATWALSAALALAAVGESIWLTSWSWDFELWVLCTALGRAGGIVAALALGVTHHLSAVLCALVCAAGWWVMWRSLARVAPPVVGGAGARAMTLRHVVTVVAAVAWAGTSPWGAAVGLLMWASDLLDSTDRCVRRVPSADALVMMLAHLSVAGSIGILVASAA